VACPAAPVVVRHHHLDLALAVRSLDEPHRKSPIAVPTMAKGYGDLVSRRRCQLPVRSRRNDAGDGHRLRREEGGARPGRRRRGDQLIMNVPGAARRSPDGAVYRRLAPGSRRRPAPGGTSWGVRNSRAVSRRRQRHGRRRADILGLPRSKYRADAERKFIFCRWHPFDTFRSYAVAGCGSVIRGWRR